MSPSVWSENRQDHCVRALVEFLKEGSTNLSSLRIKVARMFPGDPVLFLARTPDGRGWIELPISRAVVERAYSAGGDKASQIAIEKTDPETNKVVGYRWSDLILARELYPDYPHGKAKVDLLLEELNPYLSVDRDFEDLPIQLVKDLKRESLYFYNVFIENLVEFVMTDLTGAKESFQPRLLSRNHFDHETLQLDPAARSTLNELFVQLEDARLDPSTILSGPRNREPLDIYSWLHRTNQTATEPLEVRLDRFRQRIYLLYLPDAQVPTGQERKIAILHELSSQGPANLLLELQSSNREAYERLREEILRYITQQGISGLRAQRTFDNLAKKLNDPLWQLPRSPASQ